jgi:Ser/Thr protein kinase RdoA (MazF antagonist)
MGMDNEVRVSGGQALGPYHIPAAIAIQAAYSLLAPDALLAHVASTYEVGDVISCEVVKHGLNDTYRVHTSSGGYFLRVYGAAWRSRADVAYEVELLAHLVSRGVPVAHAILDRGGNPILTLNAPEGVRVAALFAGAPGKAITYDDWETLARRMGEAIGRIHVGADDFVCPRARFTLDARHLLDEPLAALRLVLTHRPADARYVAELADRLRERLLLIEARGLNRGPCHGDILSGNAYVAPGWHSHLLRLRRLRTGLARL